MTLTIPYKYSALSLNTKSNGDVELELSNSDELVTLSYDINNATVFWNASCYS